MYRMSSASVATDVTPIFSDDLRGRTESCAFCCCNVPHACALTCSPTADA